MKKRTKKKIHQRIIRKLISGQPLSDFDRKYHEEMVRKVYETKPKVHLYAENKLVTTIDEEPLPAGSKVWKPVDGRHPMLTIFDEVHQIPEKTSALADEEAEPNRWQKITSKVKGWFVK